MEKGDHGKGARGKVCSWKGLLVEMVFVENVFVERGALGKGVFVEMCVRGNVCSWKGVFVEKGVRGTGCSMGLSRGLSRCCLGDSSGFFQLCSLGCYLESFLGCSLWVFDGAPQGAL